MCQHLLNFDETVDRIKRQQAFGISSYAFITGIVDNPDRNEKFLNSYAGHALDLCLRSVQTGLILFCSRHWDENADVQSIPAANAHANEALPEIVGRHREYFEANDNDRDADEFFEYFRDLSRDVETVRASPTRTQIRVLRTEQYAHLTSGSRDRDRALRENPLFDMDDLTVNSLLIFARQTVELGERFLYLKDRISPAFDDRVAHWSRYYDQFWEHLPVFSEVEEPVLPA